MSVTLVAATQTKSSNHPGSGNDPVKKVKFTGTSSFLVELRRRVEEFLRTTGRRQRDCWQMYLKTAIILTVFAASYVLLVFFAATWWQAVPLAILWAWPQPRSGSTCSMTPGIKAIRAGRGSTR